MPLVLGGSAIPLPVVYSVDNSCRFNGDAYMGKASSSVAEKKIGTISFWMKRGNITAAQTNIVNHNNTGYCVVALLSGSQIRFYSGEHDLSSTQELRDPTAWYHIFVNWDTTESVAADRINFYINGTLVTDFATETYPTLNAELPFFVDSEDVVVGANATVSNYFDGYLAEVVALEGTAAAVTDFGEFDEDTTTLWKPIDQDQSGNKGANGFYLDFDDSANLGNDAYGGTDFTEVSLAAADQATDSPTNNFCTVNPLDNYYAQATFSEGNCQVTASSSGKYSPNTSTIWMGAGKWYMEIVETTGAGGGVGQGLIGITDHTSGAYGDELGNTVNEWGYYQVGGYRNNDTTTSYGDSWTADDIMGIALDLDNSKLYFAKNGVWQDSGDPTSGATGTGAISITAVASTTFGMYVFASSSWATTSQNFQWNTGGCPAFAISSGNADANGYGNFEYAVPSGYLALCTKNLATDGGI